MLRQTGSLPLKQPLTELDNSGTSLNVEEGVDFQLIGVPPNRHKANIYLSSYFSTCDETQWSWTPLEDESVSVLSVCL